MLKMKKIFALVLALLILCAALVSCSGGDTPDGMKSATLAGEPFVLYVPEGFTDNTASGISSAYYASVDNTLMVSARYYTHSDAEMTLDEYMLYCADSYALSLEAFEKTEYAARLKATGVITSYICPLMYMNNPLCKKMPVITSSNKLRTYTSARYYTDAEILTIITGGER